MNSLYCPGSRASIHFMCLQLLSLPGFLFYICTNGILFAISR